VRNTKEQTAFILRLKNEREITRENVPGKAWYKTRKPDKGRPQKWQILAGAAACLIVLIGVVTFLTGLIDWPFPKEPKPGASEVPFLSIDGIFYSPIENRGQLFSLNSSALTITPGEVLGMVIGYDFHTEERIGIYSNILKEGTTILEWSGYSPEFRVCARDNNGELRAFERSYLGVKQPQRGSVVDLFNFQDRVVEILICNNNPSEIGRITDPAVIEQLMTDFTEHAKFVDVDKQDDVYQENQFYRLYLRLSDNSVTAIVVSLTSGYGNWIRSIKLPDGFAASLSEHVLGPMTTELPNYGNLSANADYGLELIPEASSLVRPDLYAPEEVWVDGTTGHLYLELGGNSGQYLLADDAQADVRIEGQDIYYLSRDGKVMRIRFEYPNDPTGLWEAVAAGEDLSASIKSQEVLAAGHFIRLQVRLGVIWTLSQDGILQRNGNSVAEHVTSFALDPLGVAYSDGQEIWRKQTDGEIKKLADTDAVTMATADIYLYYAPSSGGIWKMRLDGANNQRIYDLNAQKIVYKNGVLAILERDTSRIFLSLLDRQLVDTPYRSVDLDIGLYKGLVYIDQATGKLATARYRMKIVDGIEVLELD
jgi:hypothetical protein